jgi:NADPH2:quinone reductase
MNQLEGKVAVPTTQLAVLPNAVSFAQAATVPIAGLTALRSLEKGGMLWKQPVLVTGATGGVGDFAVQLAHWAGVYVVATTRTAQREAFLRSNGANEVCTGDYTAQAQRFGPYHLILDSVGGKTLSEALSPLALFQAGGTGVYALALFHELHYRPAAPDLARLVQALADGTLTPTLQ